jgi:Domain of unknown function (DUF397)
VAALAERGVWRKSRHSGNDANCVEIAWLAGGVGIRDSKSPDGGRVTVSPAVFGALLAELRDR